MRSCSFSLLIALLNINMPPLNTDCPYNQENGESVGSGAVRLMLLGLAVMAMRIAWALTDWAVFLIHRKL